MNDIWIIGKEYMVKYVDECVGCPKEMGCIGSGCPYIGLKVYICDLCGSENALYHMEYQDYCEECARQYLQEAFNELIISEKAKSLGIDFSVLE